MGKAMTALPWDTEIKRFRPLSKHWQRLVLLGLISAVVVVAAKAQTPISCEQHAGAFSNGFSADFDVSRLDCRVSTIKNSPTIQFLAVSPYVRIVR